MNHKRNEFYEEIAGEEDLDKRVVEAVVRSSFSFVRECMEDPDEVRPILLHGWGTFHFRNRKKKMNVG